MDASRKQRRAMPRPIAATPRREPFTMLIIRLKPRPSEVSDFGLLRMYASVSTKSTSAVGTERVPSLSLIRLMRMLLGVPSARVAGTRKRARPRRPGSAPSGRARVAIALASTLEQNHLEPLSSQRFSPPPGAGRGGGPLGPPGGAAARPGQDITATHT